MLDIVKIRSFSKKLFSQKVVFGITSFILLTVLFLIFPPQAVDWHLGFYKVSQNLFHPYDIELFINPPWMALFIYPFRYLSENIGLAINSSLNFFIIGLLVIKRKGNILSLTLALTSYPFISMLANGNIEWIPALGFILQDKWGLPLLLVKPQTGILAIMSWDSLRNNHISFFVPTILIISMSFIVWGNWPVRMLANIQHLQGVEQGLASWNYSLFPWSIPLGLGLLFYIIKFKSINSEIYGVLATLCLAPYFAPYSLTISFALISATHHRIAIAAWILLWVVLIYTNWPFVSQALGILR